MQAGKVWKEQEALDAIRSVLHKTCGTDPALVQPEARLVDDLDVDSLGMLEAVIESEEIFGVSIDAGELSPQLTVAELLAVLRSKGAIA